MRDLMNEVKVRLITSKKNIIYLLTPEQKIIKTIPVIKQFKIIININNSFLQARTDYVK